MTKEELIKHKRVWINSPSTLQPYHKYHSKVGIAEIRKHKTGYEETIIHFTEGPIHSMRIDPLYLSPKY